MQSPFLKKEEAEQLGEKFPEFGSGWQNPLKKPIIKIDNLDVVYFAGKNNEARALDNINLEIFPEEYVIFFGPSGSGKSTLLNIIAGLEVPSRGRVTVDSQDLSVLSSNDLAVFHRRKTGMIFQTYNLISTLDVLDNIVVPLIFERVGSKERNVRGRYLLNKLGIDSFEKRLPQELSGGQQQRVGIGRALINNPPILLADEATGNLDSEAAHNVLEIFNTLNIHDKKTIISVTHNPEHLAYADRVFFMKDGKIIKVEVNYEKKKIRGESEEGGIKKERTELDLLLQAYPDLSSMQIQVMLAPFKAKMLVAYLLNNFDYEEIERMQQAITNRLLGRISKEDLLNIFDNSLEEGGIGLNKNTAIKFSRIVEEVVAKADFIQQETPLLKESQADPVRETITDIRMALLEEFTGELSLDQVAALDKGIEFRLYSKIGTKEFREFLDRPFEKGGAGLNKKSARNLARKLEIIMLVKFGS
jgi:putative ABC transport system ATP-binding protein